MTVGLTGVCGAERDWRCPSIGDESPAVSSSQCRMSRHDPNRMPYVAGTLGVIALFLVGVSAPVFMEMFRDFGMDPLPPHLRVVSAIHWWWTVPVGFGIAIALASGRDRWSMWTNRIASATVIVFWVAILLAFALSVFTPVFRL
jgi:hypothetical protein